MEKKGKKLEKRMNSVGHMTEIKKSENADISHGNKAQIKIEKGKGSERNKGKNL